MSLQWEDFPHFLDDTLYSILNETVPHSLKFSAKPQVFTGGPVLCPFLSWISRHLAEGKGTPLHRPPSPLSFSPMNLEYSGKSSLLSLNLGFFSFLGHLSGFSEASKIAGVFWPWKMYFLFCGALAPLVTLRNTEDHLHLPLDLVQGPYNPALETSPGQDSCSGPSQSRNVT